MKQPAFKGSMAERASNPNLPIDNGPQKQAK